MHEGRELHALDVDPDELGALGVLPDGEQGAAERSLHDAPEHGGHDHG